MEKIRKRMICFTPAVSGDEKAISALRRIVWAETYRGVYPDEAIDGYCGAWHEKRDLERILDPAHEVFIIKDGEMPVGYFSFVHNEKIHISSLYVLKEYKGMGAGRTAFSIVRDYCLNNGFSSFTVNCNEHNLPARAFYVHLGGKIVSVDAGHKNKREDQVTYLFIV